MGRIIQDDTKIRDILMSVKTIALVGASPKPERPSNQVMGFLLSKGYRVLPVNPGLAGREIQGMPVYAELASIAEPIDMVDVFRASEHVDGVVDDVLKLTPLPRVIWMQLGVYNEKAAARAGEKGIQVVMDRCPAIEYPRLMP